jgi:predicted aspartyl protease
VLPARGFACLLLAISGLSRAEPPGSDLRSLFEAGDWFKLRIVAERSGTPAFYKGAAACAFHDTRRAEEYFQRVIKSGTDSKQVFDAHGQLAHMYMRTGQYRKTYEHLSAMQRLNPEYSGLKGGLALFSALSQYPELSVARRQSSRLNMSHASHDFFIPVSVNGRSAAYGFDTGMNVSTMSEAEASRLGLQIHDASSSEFRDGASGNAVPVRFSILDRLSIGNTELQHVIFLVIPNDAMPFRELPADKQGFLGLPAFFALETMRWTSDHVMEVGFSSHRHRRSPNLCFQGATPLVEASFGGRSISAWLDTGNSKTYLTQRFAREFSEVVENRGTRATAVLRGVGGSTNVEVVRIPELTFAVDGSDLTLRPAEVLPAQNDADRHSYHIWLGMDVLGSARAVTIDFKSMTVAIEQHR